VLSPARDVIAPTATETFDEIEPLMPKPSGADIAALRR
jgi:hypothetical protein